GDRAVAICGAAVRSRSRSSASACASTPWPPAESLRAVAQVEQAPRLEADLVEADFAPVGRRRLRLEADLGLDVACEGEMADELPFPAIRRSVKCERRAHAGDAQPDLTALDDEAVRIVRRSPRH